MAQLVDSTTSDLTEIWAQTLASLADGVLTPQQRAFVEAVRSQQRTLVEADLP